LLLLVLVVLQLHSHSKCSKAKGIAMVQLQGKEVPAGRFKTMVNMWST
jgi:hypothetical protein